MPTSEITSNLYLQLGIAGATLLILLVFVILLFRLITVINNNGNDTQNNKIEKLCDKIDDLITNNAMYTQKLNEVIINNDKDQKETLNFLDKLLELAIDTQMKVSKIEDRRFKCLNDKKKKGDL